jgi:hypothetical protein
MGKRIERMTRIRTDQPSRRENNIAMPEWINDVGLRLGPDPSHPLKSVQSFFPCRCR